MSRTAEWLLVSDIDETLTGDAAALSALWNAVAATEDRLQLALNSSRPAVSVAETLTDEFPPDFRPAAVITALGTEIAMDGAPLASWSERFEGWPHERIFEILAGRGHRPHDPIFQTPLKVSFAVPPEAQPAAREALTEAGIDADIISSGLDDFDVIPKGAGKGAATLHLAAEIGVSRSKVIVAGDSGNDVAMFRVVERGIVVGNARSELIAALEPGTFYQARDAYAAGVKEGLEHYGALPGPAVETRD